MEEPEKPFGHEESADADAAGPPPEQPPPNTTAAANPPQSESELDDDHRMSVDSDYFPATIPEESEDDLKMLESDEPVTDDPGLPSELEPKQLAKLHDLKESNA